MYKRQVIKGRKDLEIIVNEISQHQKADPKLINIRQKIQNADEIITKYYCIHAVSYTHLPSSVSYQKRVVLPGTGPFPPSTPSIRAAKQFEWRSRFPSNFSFPSWTKHLFFLVQYAHECIEVSFLYLL